MTLFSVFDPVSFLGISFGWWSGVLSVCFLIPSFYWLSKSQIQHLILLLLEGLKLEFSAVLGSVSPGSMLMPLSLFGLVLSINFSGLLPYVFPCSSHLVFSVSLALPMWLGYFSVSWWHQTNFMLAHLVPTGSPSVLIPFMVLIEIVSNIIRPLTLSVRLAANIIAGHLLFTLLSGQGSNVGWGVISILLVGLGALAVLESAVAFIQAYVFSILFSLYVSEVQSKSLLLSN